MNVKLHLSIFVVFVAILLAYPLRGQDSTSSFDGFSAKNNLRIDVRSDLVAQHHHATRRTAWGFEGQYLNLDFNGDLGKGYRYRMRHRLNRAITDGSSFFQATDFAWLAYDMTERWSIIAGKQAIGMGGFEYDYAPIDVYWWSDFCNQLARCYEMGLSLQYNISKQSFLFQITNSPFIQSQTDGLLAYNLLWYGDLNHLKTIYSVNLIEYKKGAYTQYFNLGHRFEWASLCVEVDFMNRYTYGDPYLFHDYSVVGQMFWEINTHYRLMAKGGWDKNRKQVETATATALLPSPNPYIVLPQTDYRYALLGVEFFPKNDRSVRLHSFFGIDNQQQHSLFFALGATWHINVF